MRKKTIGLLLLLAVLGAGRSARAECQSNDDCKNGRICESGQCTDVWCSRDIDCATGICQNGVCAAAVGSPAPGMSAPAPGLGAPPPVYSPYAPPQVRMVEKRKSLVGLWVSGLVL